MFKPDKSTAEIKVIPVVSKGEKIDGKVALDLKIFTEKEDWADAIDGFCACAEKIFLTKVHKEKGAITLIYDEKLDKDSYTLEICDDVKIFASDYYGAVYGLATVLQLATVKDGKFEFEKIKISDHPDKDYRGLMVDLAREWHPFDKVLKYVDVCYFFKIKYLHLHVMDDEGYVLPSKLFPLLSKDGRKYTFEEIEYLCKYAKQRGVVLIPEIEMPGHVKVLNTYYPGIFSDTIEEGCDVAVFTENGIAMGVDTVLCPGSESVFENLKKLICEVIEMFGDIEYIHLGGDEVNTLVWEKCSVCKEYMEKNNIKNAHELYCEFTARVTDYVLSKGITPIIWEGVPKEYSHMISKEVIVISWENHYQMTDELLEGGYKIINGSWQPLYIVPSIMPTFDWKTKEILDWNVYQWQHWWPNSKAFLNPVNVEPTDMVWGAQISAWQQTYDAEIADVVENLAAMSERVWRIERKRTLEEYARAFHILKMKCFNLIV